MAVKPNTVVFCTRQKGLLTKSLWSRQSRHQQQQTWWSRCPRSKVKARCYGLFQSFCNIRDRDSESTPCWTMAAITSYINSSVAHKLGLQGDTEEHQVNVLNGKRNTFKTTAVSCELVSVDGNMKAPVTFLTADRVTGDLQPVDWRLHADKWPHLVGIPFPELGPKPYIDVLLGVCNRTSSVWKGIVCEQRTGIIFKRKRARKDL